MISGRDSGVAMHTTLSSAVHLIHTLLMLNTMFSFEVASWLSLTMIIYAARSCYGTTIIPGTHTWVFGAQFP